MEAVDCSDEETSDNEELRNLHVDIFTGGELFDASCLAHTANGINSGHLDEIVSACSHTCNAQIKERTTDVNIEDDFNFIIEDETPHCNGGHPCQNDDDVNDKCGTAQLLEDSSSMLAPSDIDREKLCLNVNLTNLDINSVNNELLLDKIPDAEQGDCLIEKSFQNTCNDSCFTWLPREITLKIFSMFSLQEHLRVIRRVCKDWFHLSQDPILWKRLDFGGYSNISLLDLSKFVCDYPLLQDLSLRGRKNIDVDELSILMGFCQALQSLDLGFCDRLDIMALEAVVKNCPNLNSINLEGCNEVDLSFLCILCKGEKLGSFNFSHCTKLNDESIVYLIDFRTYISSLNIDGIPWISDELVEKLVDCHHETLTCLVLDGDELTDISISAVSRCGLLKILKVSFCEGLTDISLRYIADMESLHELQLRKGMDFSTEELIRMFKCGKLSSLTHLDLSECSAFTDQGVIELVNCCGKSLKCLSLGWCWNIYDTGLEHIIKKCGNLENLVLTGIDKIRGEILISVPELMPKLKLLDLSQCNKIDDSVIEEILKVKTDLTVFDYYGRKFGEFQMWVEPEYLHDEEQ